MRKMNDWISKISWYEELFSVHPIMPPSPIKNVSNPLELIKRILLNPRCKLKGTISLYFERLARLFFGGKTIIYRLDLGHIEITIAMRWMFNHFSTRGGGGQIMPHLVFRFKFKCEKREKTSGRSLWAKSATQWHQGDPHASSRYL